MVHERVLSVRRLARRQTKLGTNTREWIALKLAALFALDQRRAEFRHLGVVATLPRYKPGADSPFDIRRQSGRNLRLGEPGDVLGQVVGVDVLRHEGNLQIQANVVVLIVAEDEDMSGEARNRSGLALPGAQQALFDRVD